MAGMRDDNQREGIMQTVVEQPTDLLEKVSASRLNTFHQCRLKFYFRYVLQLQKPQTAALLVGSVVHSVLQFWSMARWKNITVGPEQLEEHFHQKWTDEQEGQSVQWAQGEEEEQKRAAWPLLQTYFANTPIPLNEKPEAVEVTVEADLSKHGLPTLVGIIDLVRNGGRIVEFKTTGQTPNAEKAEHIHELQTSCYSVLYRHTTGKEETSIELHHLVKLKTPKLVVTPLAPMTEAQQTRLFKVMESYVQGVERQDWVPSPSPMACACCEYFNECRRWS
ncbi:MAG: RecB family exonuclease [Limisphaerales bacterium]